MTIIEVYRLLAIRGRLHLELKGLKFRGGSTFAYVKRQFQLKGSRAKVLAAYEQLLRDKGILPNDETPSR